MTAVYDGRFESFLTLIYNVYHEKLKVAAIRKEPPDTLFQDTFIQVTYDDFKSSRVLEALKKKFKKRHFETILNIFMCDSEAFELRLLEFIVLGFKDQAHLDNINHPSVFYIQNLQKELLGLSHRMSGFVRFEELEDGTLYARLDTKFNVIFFLGRHFLKRFNNQDFILHDIKRELAFIKNRHMTGIQNVASYETPTLSRDEERFKQLWKTFFESTAIGSRTNKKLQQQFVPLVYRTYMTEFL